MSAPKKKPVPSRKSGPATLTGSDQAKRQAAVFLEVLSGLRSPGEACEVLGLSLPRYYILETRGLQGMINALEPLPRGRQLTEARQIELLNKEKAALEREIVRYQTLVRAANRSIGLPATRKGAKKKKAGAKKKRKPRVRALKVIEALGSERQQGAATPSDGVSVEAQVPGSAA